MKSLSAHDLIINGDNHRADITLPEYCRRDWHAYRPVARAAARKPARYALISAFIVGRRWAIIVNFYGWKSQNKLGDAADRALPDYDAGARGQLASSSLYVISRLTAIARNILRWPVQNNKKIHYRAVGQISAMISPVMTAWYATIS